MNRRSLMLAALAAAFAGGALAQHRAGQEDAGLKAAIASPARTPANAARDRYRHPYETLRFFGLKPNQTVVEIWPSGGWYTEILAPYLAQGGGTYWAVEMSDRRFGRLRKRMAEDSARYGKVRTAIFPLFGGAGPKVPDGSADLVLTFRNVHNMTMGEDHGGQPYQDEAFREIYRMLKPGGMLGIVDHRLPEAADSARERESGYLKVSTVRRAAEAAGFRFAGASEVNANPRDTTDWPKGVWTLPPTLTLGAQDRDKYLAIGESDRMTIRFRKPAAARRN